MTDPIRRRFLARIAAGLGTSALTPVLARAGREAPRVPPPPPHRDPPGGERFVQPLRLAGARGLLAEVRASRPIELVARVDPLPVFPGRASNVWNYAARIDGREVADPLLVVRRGDILDATLHNRLGQDTTIHWHGLHVDEANDGSGLHPVHHEQRYRYRFRVDNRAGLYWYHAHPHFHTGEQVHQGLAGLLLVEDDQELALRRRLDLPWGVRDIPLLIADKQLGRKNVLAYKTGADDWIGNRVLVNWTPEPRLEVQRALHRFRLANLSNARMFNPAFVVRGKPIPFWLIGTDGGLLSAPQRVTDCYLAPAQRLDVLVDFSALAAGDRVRLRSLAYDPMENDAAAAGEDPMLEHPGAAPMGAELDLMELHVKGGAPTRADIPRVLAPIGAVRADGAATTRRFRFRISDSGRWMINDWNFLLDGHASAFRVRRGDVEAWEFTNEFRSMPHPIHVHGFSFRVLGRSKSPPQVARRFVDRRAGLLAQDLGWLDTVVVWPGERVRILVDFAQPFAGDQTYMLHCHNLEHEDQGMMVAFTVGDAA
jgi:FtsP/CotA-like multicopper oxidase with cupredoxin domain